MLLRRMIEHVKAQNWTAVALDFFIVVIGVFIGIQVSNWNDERTSRAQEAAVLAQLESEFLEIQAALQKQTSIREGYVDDLTALIAGLENPDLAPDDLVVKRALIAARSVGRRPSQSAAYLQLTANGELARLSNEDLKNALVRYHSRLERDAFIFPELMRTAIREMSSNEFVDFDPGTQGPRGAAIDDEIDADMERTSRIRSYDFDGLRAYEQRYEAMHAMHSTLVNTDNTQLELINEILAQISKGDR